MLPFTTLVSLPELPNRMMPKENVIHELSLEDSLDSPAPPPSSEIVSVKRSMSKEDEKYIEYFGPHQEPMYDKHWICHVCNTTILRYRHKMVEHVKECLRKKSVNEFLCREYTDQEIQNLPKIETFQLWEMMVELRQEVSDLRACVKKLQNNQSQRMDMIHWLNHVCLDAVPEMTFSEWRKSDLFHVSGELLKYAFDFGLKDAVQKCLENLLKTVKMETFPIRAFSKQTHVFYIYEAVDADAVSGFVWRRMAMEEFTKWIGNIQHQFLLTFNQWEEENEAEIENQANSDRMLKYMKLINAEIPNISSLRNWFYGQICKTLKKVVELEFE
jgi:hypothetical protein